MLRYMAGISLQDRVASEEVLRRCGLCDILKVLEKERMRWFGHVVRRNEDEPLQRLEWCKPHEVDLRRPGGSVWRM